MTLAQIIEALPLQVYVRRGELVIHFSSPSDLVNRVAETSAAFVELEMPRADGRPDRVGRRTAGRPVAVSGGRPDSDGVADADQPTIG